MPVPRTAPVRQYPTPELADIFLLERVSITVATNENLQPGTRYVGANLEQDAKWRTAVYLGQRAVEGSDKDVFRVWASDPVRQNLYNFSLSFSGEDSSCPIFERTSLVLRDDYLAMRSAEGSAYSGVYRARITASGEGYRTNFAVTGTGGDGTGFAGIAIVNTDGGVEHVVVIAEGDSYTTGPTLVFSAGTGVGAEGVGLVQPSSCVLVSEKTQEAPSEWNSLYLLTLSAYEKLPGPLLPDNRDDLLLGPVQRTRQAVLNTGQAANLSVNGSTTYESRDRSSVVSWEIVETWSASNFRIIVDDFFDNQRSAVHRTTQLVTDLTSLGTLVVSGGVATDTRYDGYNKFLRKKIVETWDVPATARAFKVLGRRGFVADLSERRVAAGSTPTAQSELIEVERAVEGKDRVREEVITYAAGGSPLVAKRFNRFGGLDVVTDKFVDPATVPTNVTYTVQELRQEKEKQARLIETVIATGGAIAVIDNVDPRVPGSRATIAFSLVLATDAHPSDTATEVYERLEFQDNALMRIQKKTTFAIPSTFIESEDHGFAFPTLFDSFYIDSLLGETRIQRGGFSAVVPHKVTHSFGTTRVDISPYQIIENDFLVFSMHASGLMNGIQFFKTINGVTYYYPSSSTLPASTPSKSTYSGLIGSYITIGGSSEIWRAGVFQTTTIEVILQ